MGDAISGLRRRAEDVRKAILRDPDLSATDKNVGMALIGHLNVDKLSRNLGLMWPTPETLAGEVQCCVRTVRRSLRQLRERGHFVVAIAGGGGGQGRGYGRTTRYALGAAPAAFNSDSSGPLTVTPAAFNSDSPGPLTVTGESPNSLSKPEEHLNETRAHESGFWRFWAEYPHKVDELAAAAAFANEMAEGATLKEILDGLRRYIEARPEDREWLNPANFLIRKRYRDRPAVQRSLLLPVKGGAPSPRSDGGEQAPKETWRQAIGMS